MGGNKSKTNRISGGNTAPTVSEDLTFLSPQWHFTGKIAPETETPDQIPSGCRSFRLGPDHGIDLDTLCEFPGKPGDVGIVYNEFELETDRPLGFGAGADWWMEVCLNGEKIYSNEPCGNSIHPYSADDHNFTGRGRKGKNLLSVRIRRGGASWSFFMKEKAYASAHPELPLTLTVDPERVLGPVKPMNAVNNGPVQPRRGPGNMEAWRAAKIPCVRNHDASFYSGYGAEHTVDVHAVFPDFSRDPSDPASYHFSETDRYLQTILAGGSRIFYRLGSRIEHAPEKYGTRVPPDFRKWAVICEHIIRHYNEGWADGFAMNIEYWEIWNEPDNPPGKNGSATWQGTPEQFFELYEIAATHLKKCFPKLKIGGPAVLGQPDWQKRFLQALTAGGKHVPLDFFSWHIYPPLPSFRNKGFEYRRLLDSFGYMKTESILDEWNYVRGRTEEQFLHSIQSVHGIKGAAFAAAAMISGQYAPIDMMMYYDARPSVYNGLFDFYTNAPLKTYYVVKCWSKLAEFGSQIEVDTQQKNGIYAAAAAKDGRLGILISRFFEPDDLPGGLEITLTLKNGDFRGAKLYLLDETHDLTDIPYRLDQNGNLLFTMKANSVVYVER